MVGKPRLESVRIVDSNQRRVTTVSFVDSRKKEKHDLILS